MQVSPMISTLLAGLIILLSLQAVDSLSPPRRSEPQLLTFPISPIPQPTNIHPQILLQMEINRASRRLAMMTGAAPPSKRSLQQLIEKRMLSLDLQSGIDRRFNRPRIHNEGDVQLEKRFNQVGVLNRRRMGTRQSAITDPEPPTAANSLGLSIENPDVGYLATLQLGTPPVSYKILVDTGSTDFWVSAEKVCQEVVVSKSRAIVLTNNDCGDHPAIGPSSSSTFQNLSRPFQVSYGTGFVAGHVISDIVSFAGLKTKLKFGAVVDESVDFTGSSADGLMGFALRDLSQQQVPTMVETLVTNGLIEKAITSFKLGRLADGKNDGEITLGGLDSSKVQLDTLVVLPNIDPNGFWRCALDAITINGRSLNAVGNTAIPDTGTTLIVVPNDLIDSIIKFIPGSQRDDVFNTIDVPCDSNISVAFVFGGKTFDIDPRDMIRGQLRSGDNTMCASGFSTSTGVLQGEDWLVGDVFLKNVISSFDLGENTITFGKLSG